MPATFTSVEPYIIFLLKNYREKKAISYIYVYGIYLLKMSEPF